MSGLPEHAHRSTRARECAPAILPETIAPLEQYIRPRDLLDVRRVTGMDVARAFDLPDSFGEALERAVTPEPTFFERKAEIDAIVAAANGVTPGTYPVTPEEAS